MDGLMSETDVEAVLRAEYRLLYLCDDFKKQFDAHAKDLNVVTIPSKPWSSHDLDVKCFLLSMLHRDYY